MRGEDAAAGVGVKTPSLSHSSLQVLQACPKRFYYSRIEGVERKGETRGLRRGKAFSDALEAGGDPQVVSDYYAKRIMDAVTQEYVDDLLIEEAIIIELVQAHAAKFSDDEREIEFDFPIDETGYRNHGFIDAVTFSPSGYMLKEDKLLAMWGASEQRGLPMNGQVLRYLGAAPLIWPNAIIAGMEYRVTRWPGTYRRKTESANEFGSRVASTIREKRLDGKLDELFSVHFIDFNEAKDRIARYYDDLADRVREVEQRKATDSWPHAFGEACKAFGGCEFLPACMREPGFEELYTTREKNT